MFYAEIGEIIEKCSKLRIFQEGIFLLNDPLAEDINTEPIFPFGKGQGHDSEETGNIGSIEEVLYYIVVDVLDHGRFTLEDFSHKFVQLSY